MQESQRCQAELPWLAEYTAAYHGTMNKPAESHKWVGLVVWIAVAFLPASMGYFVQPGAWYDQLEHPAWTPPSWVFGPVWTLLYLLMGIAAWRVWLRGGFENHASRSALVVFLVHLLFNAAWTGLFFGLHRINLAAVEIVILWLMIAAVIVLFWRCDRLAAALLIPYLMWVTYATTLNIGFAVLN